MTEESSTQDLSEPAVTADPMGSSRVSSGFRLVLLVVLLVALVASTAGASYLAATRPVPALGLDGEQAALQGERESVMAQAEQFMLRINTYGPDLLEGDTMPKYRDLVEEVITPKFAADFEKNAPLAEQTVKQGGLARTCQVFSTGVSSIDADSATALVAGSLTNSYPKTSGSDERVETEPAPFRVQVSLVKSHGTWLVDDFTPLTGDADESQGAQPSSGATDQPSSEPSSEPSSAPSGGGTP